MLLMRGHQARRERRMDDAKRIFAEAVEAARQSEDRPWLAQAYTELGRIERDLREVDAATGHYEDAAAIYRGLGEPLRLAHSVRHIGDILREDGRLELARERYREALAIYRAHPETPPLELGNAIRGYALLQGETGERTEALALWREARELYATVSVGAGVDECDQQIARLAPVASPFHRQ
jgi:tetratricopeptide (TPR) repeat protein